ncbi:MAG: DUF1549 domain-containing protein [Pirellulales bacterium]
MEEKGIRPSPRADKLTLLRRITLDLTGLLPTTSEQEASCRSIARTPIKGGGSPAAIGELWPASYAALADLVRYSEGDGFKTDALRPFAYKYRDYVIGRV